MMKTKVYLAFVCMMSTTVAGQTLVDGVCTVIDSAVAGAVTIAQSSVADDACCGVLRGHIIGTIALQEGLPMPWSSLAGMVGITACTTPEAHGTCVDAVGHNGDAAAMESMAQYLCTNWATCNTGGLVATGMVAAMAGAFEEAAYKTVLNCAPAPAPAPAGDGDGDGAKGDGDGDGAKGDGDGDGASGTSGTASGDGDGARGDGDGDGGSSGSTDNTPTVRIGVMLTDSAIDKNAEAALKLWEKGNNELVADNKLGVKVMLDIVPYNEATLEKDVAQLVASNANFLFPPYTSGLTKAFISFVPANTDTVTSPAIMVWGGASDSIYSDSCLNKNCFGTFTVGSKYMVEGLKSISGFGTQENKLKVAMIENDNAFSKSVCQGAAIFVETASATNNLELIPDYGLQKITLKKGALDAAGKASVATTMEAKPDVLVVCGHAGGDVEDIIIEAANSPNRPAAIIATNSLTSVANARFEQMGKGSLQNCLMMPTQQAKDHPADDFLGWTRAAFEQAMPTGGASYHSASAAAAGLAVTAALNSYLRTLGQGGSPTMAGFVAATKEVNIQTFYGPIKFNANGSPDKPMFVEQRQPYGPSIFDSKTALEDMKVPLDTCQGWVPTPMPTRAPTVPPPDLNNGRWELQDINYYRKSVTKFNKDKLMELMGMNETNETELLLVTPLSEAPTPVPPTPAPTPVPVEVVTVLETAITGSAADFASSSFIADLGLPATAKVVSTFTVKLQTTINPVPTKEQATETFAAVWSLAASTVTVEGAFAASSARRLAGAEITASMVTEDAAAADSAKAADATAITDTLKAKYPTTHQYAEASPPTTSLSAETKIVQVAASESEAASLAADADTKVSTNLATAAAAAGVTSTAKQTETKQQPTPAPTKVPTYAPTKLPEGFTLAPTKNPTSSPTKTPTATPTGTPTKTPTATPTKTPTATPTATPTKTPTATPTKTPTATPTKTPTKAPTANPTPVPPTSAPTMSPTNASAEEESGAHQSAGFIMASVLAFASFVATQ